VGAKTGSAASANKGTAIYAACSWPERWPSSATAKVHGTKHRPWLTALLGRRPTKVAAIRACQQDCADGLAMMAKGERYKQPVALAA